MKRKDIAIAAYYETAFSKKPERDVYDYAAEAATGVLKKAGLSKQDVDGLIVTTALSGASEPMWSARINEALGLETRWLQTMDTGGTAPIAGISRAASAIRDGSADVVLFVAADAPITESNENYMGYRTNFEFPFGPMGPPGLFGFLQKRYNHQYGITVEQLAKVAVTQRRHAQLNPNALLQGEMTVETYWDSRMISDPIRLLDCVMRCNGGDALVITSAERARELTPRPVYVTGVGEVHNYRASELLADVTDVGMGKAGRRALEEAGLSISDIQTFQPYDDFVIAVILQLESLGFCGVGEGGRFVERTDLSFQGDLPLNTGGGQLSTGQNGLAGGAVNVIEAVRQLQREGGARQVEKCDNALVTGIGTVNYLRNWHSSAVMVLEV
ncbi:MAG: thiolase family protein [Nitrospinota bacterium]|jgi:acetyl-CoA acetyltransferase|nr:thiolase family protein [Nitrospinota bacterium]